MNSLSLSLITLHTSASTCLFAYKSACVSLGWKPHVLQFLCECMFSVIQLRHSQSHILFLCLVRLVAVSVTLSRSWKPIGRCTRIDVLYMENTRWKSGGEILNSLCRSSDTKILDRMPSAIVSMLYSNTGLSIMLLKISCIASVCWVTALRESSSKMFICCMWLRRRARYSLCILSTSTVSRWCSFSTTLRIVELASTSKLVDTTLQFFIAKDER